MRLGVRWAGAAAVMLLIVSGTNWSPPATADNHCTTTVPEVDVTDFGAFGDGVTDDRAAIQCANDAVAALDGGGRVFFPPGTYLVTPPPHDPSDPLRGALTQDSHVEFHGNDADTTVIFHDHGGQLGRLISSRVHHKTSGGSPLLGSINKNSSTLTVNDPNADELIEDGSVVAIRGAGGASEVQHTKLLLPLLSFQNSMVTESSDGFFAGAGYMLVGSEIVRRSNFVGSVANIPNRGLYGTQAQNHGPNVAVSQLKVHYATVQSVNGSTIELSEPAAFKVSNAPVSVGSQDMAVSGLTLDGNVPAGSVSAQNHRGLNYELARWVTVRDTTVKNVSGRGIRLGQGTANGLVEDNVLTDNRVGVWLFDATRDSIIRSNAITADNMSGGGEVAGIILDDRTEGSTEYDGPVTGNVVENNQITFGGNLLVANTIWGIGLIGGSPANEVLNNEIHHDRRAGRGIDVMTWEGQGQDPLDSDGNTISGNTISNFSLGIHVSGSSNQFLDNTVIDADSVCVDEGMGNVFDPPFDPPCKTQL